MVSRAANRPGRPPGSVALVPWARLAPGERHAVRVTLRWRRAVAQALRRAARQRQDRAPGEAWRVTVTEVGVEVRREQ